MMPTKNKKATVKSASKISENEVYGKILQSLKKILSSSGTISFKEKTIESAAAITLKAAANASSFSAARKRMEKGTSRRQAVKPLESLELDSLLKNTNKELRKNARKTFGGSGITVSIDLHEIPYYGKKTKNVRGRKPKDGTAKCHAFATAYATVNRKRYTLAIIFVPKGTNMHTIVFELFKLVAKAGIRISLFLLDKGFYSIEVVRILKRLNIPFIMPMRGNRLKKRRKSYRTNYTMKSGKEEEILTAYSVIKYDKGKRFNRHGTRQWSYITFAVSFSPRKIAETYRKRFGIESSYKLSKKTRARTSSRNVAYRAFLLFASFLLQNTWVRIKRMFCFNLPKHSNKFISLRDFADIIVSVIRSIYGEITTFIPPS